jgi:hypothetical protein
MPWFSVDSTAWNIQAQPLQLPLQVLSLDLWDEMG